MCLECELMFGFVDAGECVRNMAAWTFMRSCLVISYRSRNQVHSEAGGREREMANKIHNLAFFYSHFRCS